MAEARLLFSISGLPLGDGAQKFDYASGIRYVAQAGLDGVELSFVHSVNVTDANRQAVSEAQRDTGMYLSAHGSYYVNLNAADIAKQEQSLERIVRAADALRRVGGRSLVFHPGFYLDSLPGDAYETICANLKKLPYGGVDYRLETTGKPSQFGTLVELVALCREIPACKLCIDFSHIHARQGGSLKAYADFAGLLQYVLDELGPEALADLHMHMSGVRYGARGELSHLPLQESDFGYLACLRALKDFGVGGCVVSEGPLVEQDALLLKGTYLAL